jgi:hypothetical protein
MSRSGEFFLISSARYETVDISPVTRARQPTMTGWRRPLRPSTASAATISANWKEAKAGAQQTKSPVEEPEEGLADGADQQLGGPIIGQTDEEGASTLRWR